MKYLIAALAAPLSGSDGPVNLIPDGTFRAVDGRPAGLEGWRLDAEIATALLSRCQSKKTQLVINYEHPDAVGQPMPAAGWVDRATLSYQPGVGITAPVRWTARAKSMIDAGEYAYLSPVISYDADTGAVVDLHLAGLTNTPALDSLQPLAALAERLGLDLPTSTEDNRMNLAALRQALGLAEDAGEPAIMEKVMALVSQTKTVAALTEQVAALKAAAPDLSQYVPRAVHEETLAALREAGTHAAQAELTALIEKGIADGRIPGEQTAAWLKAQPLDAVKRYLADAPVIAALTQTQTGGKPPATEKRTALTDEQRAVCQQMGIAEDAYLKTLEAMA